MLKSNILPLRNFNLSAPNRKFRSGRGGLEGKTVSPPRGDSGTPPKAGWSAKGAIAPMDKIATKWHILSDHMRIDERSIALHKAIAERIKSNPKLIRIAKENLKRWKEQYLLEAEEIPPCLIEWEKILSRKSLEKILELLVSSGEEGRRLRQSSPFAGILPNRDRIKINESFTIGTYYSGRRKHQRG
ncbi:MAG: hypothetical protein AB1393_07845 [Candidatus Edwardsbacteria bacterium]